MDYLWKINHSIFFLTKFPCLSILMFSAWKLGWDERTAQIYFNTLSGTASKPLTVGINWQKCIFIVFIWLSLKRSDLSLKKGYSTKKFWPKANPYGPEWVSGTVQAAVVTQDLKRSGNHQHFTAYACLHSKTSWQSFRNANTACLIFDCCSGLLYWTPL